MADTMAGRSPGARRTALTGIVIVVLVVAVFFAWRGARDDGPLPFDRRDAGASVEGRVVVDYPPDEAVFPPDIVAPTFLWHDDSRADAWRVEVALPGSASRPSVSIVVPGTPPSPGAIDAEALGPTNEVYRPTPYQASARSWTPPPALWEQFKELSASRAVTCRVHGVSAANPATAHSVGAFTFSTSEDPVGAPIFYRDVPLMPAVGAKGLISPLGLSSIPLIRWRLRDVSRPESKVVLEGMPSCANCHSFSQDGQTFGMDVDGPQGDKGTYAIASVQEEMVIETADVITWNSFPDKPEGHKTIGFLSRVSPDGRHVLSTVNEALYVANYPDYAFLQVFYPTRGILAYYARDTQEMKALPGADDTRYVHCGPAWTPDGKTIVFSRAEAFDPYEAGRPLATEPNDPNEPRIRYDLYRMPFDGGRGGTPEPIVGASHNGMSNTFPKVSPDGRWVVFTKCRNGQLMRPDGKLWIVPLEGGSAREMRCNTSLMNSWHSFSPNGRWMVFSSKANTPYTQMFLTHVDEEGNDTPPILIPASTDANRAVNLPEFANISYAALERIEVPAVNHHRHLQDGVARMKQRDLEGAIPFLEKAVEIEPDFGMAHANLGNALSLRGDLERAAKHLRRSLELHPESAFAWNSLGYVLGRQGDWRRALDHFHRALEISPRSPYGHNNVGLAMRELGEPDRALQAFTRAVELDPNFPDARKNLAYALMDKRRYGEAARHYRRAAELDPRDAVAIRSLASALLKSGDAEGGIRALERLVDVAPDDVGGLASLAWHLATHPDAALRDGRRSVEVAERARRLTRGRDVKVLGVLAAAYAEAGRFDDAVSTTETQLKLFAEGVTGPASAPEHVQDRLRRYRAGKPVRQSPRRDEE